MPSVSSIEFPIEEADADTIPREFAKSPDETAKLFDFLLEPKSLLLV